MLYSRSIRYHTTIASCIGAKIAAFFAFKLLVDKLDETERTRIHCEFAEAVKYSISI